ncbi:MAG: peptide ABC transporter substrate-binding protein [Acidimicrobiia bacterium]|nr:MAG: peptide ABC transporter substrate-binding protein [Acidimicrobiia bacterium]
MRSRWVKPLAVLVVVAACTSTGTTTSGPGTTGGATGPGTSPPTATGGTVRIGWGGSPDSLNPGNGLLTEAYTIYELVYDTPIGLDLDGNYVPELAEEWSVSDDGLTWTMKLVENARFHDGTPLTSEDVKFSLELWRDNEDFPFLPSYPDVFTIEAPDPTTVVLTTEEPIGNFESRMVFMYIVPKHIWEEIDDPVAYDNADMIGSGSFELAEYRQGEFVRLEANKDYWGGAPNIDGVIFQTIENPDARVAALRAGDVDMITEMPNTAISTLQSDPNIEVVIGEPLAPGLSDIFFNIVPDELCPAEDGVCSGHPALKDLQVRLALAHAVDKQQLIDVALLGLGTPGISLVPTGLGGYFNSSLVDYPFDLDEARQILEDAGYLDTDGDGIRECKPDQSCDDLTFRFNYPSDSDTAPREVEMVSAWWKEIGVATVVQGLDPDTLTSVCCPTFDYDVIRWGWGSDPDPGFLLGVALCSEIDSGFSETGYCNPEYDALYDQQATETDPETRREIVWQMQEILLRDLPYIIPYYDLTVQAYRKDTFTGWRTDATKLALEDPTSLNVIRPAG